jgi:hypothetical protein
MSKSRRSEPLIKVFDDADRRTTGAYFWDWLRDGLPAWKDLEYEWIASSCFGDQIILTHDSPIHAGSAVYMHGPDVGGPDSNNPNWPDNVLYLGSSVKEWIGRLKRFGDEYSVIPGDIDNLLDEPEVYREIYRRLNPGLPW